MGIDIRVETENGEALQELLDPQGLTSWLLGLGDISQTVCLRFVDPYGDTVFNQTQLPVLRAEIQALARSISGPALHRAKQAYLARAHDWPEGAQREARERLATLASDALRDHLRQVTSLIHQAQGQPHIYVRFAGD